MECSCHQPTKYTMGVSVREQANPRFVTRASKGRPGGHVIVQRAAWSTSPCVSRNSRILSPGLRWVSRRQVVSPELSVVVPVHNEAPNLAGLLAEIRDALDGLAEYELVCVDDGSDDDTPRLLATLSAEFPRLTVVRHRSRAGQSAATAHGV